jgi:histidine ammonia-lyase
MNDHQVLIGGSHRVSIDDLEAVARGGEPAMLGKEVPAIMERSQKMLRDHIDNRLPIYGLTTQFGNQAHLLDSHIGDTDSKEYEASIRERQRNLVRSHNTGLGEELPEDVSRGAMLLRAHCVSIGYSGVRPLVPETLLQFLAADLTPVIRRYGSIGASGDLIPLSSIAASLIGEDTDVWYVGKKMSAKGAIKKAGITPLTLEGREGLALINGTSVSTSFAALTLFDLQILFPQLLSTIAFALESMQVMDSGYEPLVHALKHHEGEIEVNEFLLEAWKGSKLVRHLHAIREEKLKAHDAGGSDQSLQDYYSLRSVPQGFGAFCENIDLAGKWIEDEMNAVSDNPIVDVEQKKVHHGANFMGHYITEACDLLKTDIAQASTWIHALLANMVHPRKNFGLSTNLIERPDIQNGFRPLQILSASLAVQNRKLAQSQQAFMLPTEGDNQDVNSLSMHAAFDFQESVHNLERLTAILFFGAMQAIEMRGVTLAGARAQQAHAQYREHVPFLKHDRMVRNDIEETILFLRDHIL